MERVSARVERSDWYRLETYFRAGAQSQVLVRVVVPDGDVFPAMAGGSMADPAASLGAFTVGAVRADGYLDNPVKRFSSQGPTFDGRYKPDIAGPDGLSTEAYGGLGFYGTSASTPAVAGALALVLSEDPSLEPSEAALRLQALAITDAALLTAPDPALGAGKAHLPVEATPQPCGRRPLLLPLFMTPLGWLRSRLQSRRSRRDAP
jgi:subtilisin family serine protease